MGFILNALGAAAGAGADIMSDNRKSEAQLQQQRALSADTEQRQLRLAADGEQRQLRLAEFNKNLDMQKQREIEKLKLEMAPLEAKARADAEDAARVSRAKELSSARDGIVNKAMAGKLNKFYNDGKTRNFEDFSPEELASQEAQLTDEERSGALRQAGLQTGQLSAKDALADDAKVAQRDYLREKAQLQYEAQTAKTEKDREVAMARLQALSDRVGAQGSSAAREERIGWQALLKDTSDRIDNESKKLKDLPRGKMGEEERAAINAKIAALESDRTIYQKALVGVTEGFGSTSPKGAQKTDKPKVDATATIEQARQVIAKNPKNRDEVIRRLKASGIPVPKDL